MTWAPRGLRAAPCHPLARMLTDYHVHLRPDGDDTPPSGYFTAALDVWAHPWWRRWATDDLEAYVGFVREETDLRLGFEADFVAGREDRLASLLEGYEWDYVVGSVQFLGDYSVDVDDETDVWRHETSPERVWKRYFETLAESALTGLYDIIAHPDLAKIWGSARPLPDADPRRYYEPAIEAMLDANVAMEVSTAGLRKPVGEIYPARAMLEMAVDAGVPIALSSDAHVPEHIGYGYDQARELLEACGVKELAVFERRVRRMEPLG